MSRKSGIELVWKLGRGEPPPSQLIRKRLRLWYFESGSIFFFFSEEGLSDASISLHRQSGFVLRDGVGVRPAMRLAVWRIGDMGDFLRDSVQMPAGGVKSGQLEGWCVFLLGQKNLLGPGAR